MLVPVSVVAAVLIGTLIPQYKSSEIVDDVAVGFGRSTSNDDADPVRA